MSVTAEPLVTEPPVAKGKRPKKTAAPVDPNEDKQVNFRANSNLYGQLESIADAFGMDISNLVRLILNENLAVYRRRAERIRSGLPASEESQS